MGDYVFISYACEDHNFVLKLATELKDRGISVWLDQWDIPAGADWDQSIDSALHDCSQFLIILSPAAVASKQVRGELQTALDENKPIVPVLRQACQIPRVLRLIQYVDFTSSGPGGEPTFDRLVRALHMPEAGHSPQGAAPLTGQSRRLWLYGGMGGLLVLGLLFAWLWPLIPHKEIPIPPPPSVLQGHLQVNVNVDAARVTVDGIGTGVARRQAPLFWSNLKAGIVRIRVEADGYEPQDRRVNIVANESAQVGFVLIKHLAPEKTRTPP
jgi:hypothetical protein